MVTFPKKDKQVKNNCVECGRKPEPGETYGPHAEGWDITDICPGCWDMLFKEEEG